MAFGNYQIEPYVIALNLFCIESLGFTKFNYSLKNLKMVEFGSTT